MGGAESACWAPRLGRAQSGASRRTMTRPSRSEAVVVSPVPVLSPSRRSHTHMGIRPVGAPLQRRERRRTPRLSQLERGQGTRQGY